MPGRSVLQWDKDDCARGRAGEVRPARPGHAHRPAATRVDLVAEHHGLDLDLGRIPEEEPAVYDMLCAGRLGRGVPGREPGADGDAAAAQAAHVLRPRRRGGADPARPDPGRLGAPVHPSPQRARSRSTYRTRCCEKSLGAHARRTAVPGAADADGGRRRRLHRGRGRRAAPGDGLQALDRSAWRRLEQRLYDGMAERGVEPATWPTSIFEKLIAFANFGFPESHSVSFAYLVYASSWLKLHHPAAFCAALLQRAADGLLLPAVPGRRRPPPRRRRSAAPTSTPPGPPPTSSRSPTAPPERAVRLGLDGVRTSGPSWPSSSRAYAPQAGRTSTCEDLVRRVTLSPRQVEALATAGAFGCFGLSRREALWAAGASCR